MQERIGWIGLGNIGLPMAQRVLKAGYETTVCGHIRREPVEEMRQLGAREAATAREVAEGSDVIFTMVRDVPQTETMLFGPNGLWSGLSSGKLLALSSTLLPDYCARLARRGKEVGVSVIDAPVSGGAWGAKAGTLTFFVGAETPDFERCRPVFQAIGRNIFHLGPVGAGQVAKLSNNLLLWVHMIATQEAVRLAEQAQLPQDVLLETVKVSTGQSWVVENLPMMMELMESEEGRPKKLMYKDVGLALEFANSHGLHLPLAGLAAQLDVP